jgi:phage-related protein
MKSERKPLEWVASSRKDIGKFPREVKQAVGYALDIAQQGGKSLEAKPFRGFGGASVLELVEDYDGDTYRAVYTVKFEEAVYVLHCFQKKSKSGKATPTQDMEKVQSRLKLAEEAHKQWLEKNKKKL